MHDHEDIARNHTLNSIPALQRRATRRELFKGAARLGAGALALSVTGGVRAGWQHWTPHATADQFNSDVATEWFRLTIQISPTTPGYGPGVANRTFAYLGVTLYEAIVPGMSGYQSLVGQLNDLTPAPGARDHAYHWPTVANSALATSVRELYRMTTEENMAAIDALEASLEEQYAAGLPPGIANRSVARGRRVADHIMAWAMTDGAHDAYLDPFPADYVPPVGPGLWVPTPPAFRSAADPYGGTNRPLALGPVEDFNPGPPPPFSTEKASEFYLGQLEVYETVNNLTDEQLATANYWAVPLGHHPSLVTQGVEQSGANLAKAAEAYARSGIAAHDAGTACFYTKYHYNLIRPVSYIQAHIDPSWMSPLPTPPHPDYTAAHATVTRAFAQGVHDALGDFEFTDHTWDAVGIPPRTFTSWITMSEETGISRLYGGIHSRWAIETGLEQGARIGKSLGKLKFRRS